MDESWLSRLGVSVPEMRWIARDKCIFFMCLGGDEDIAIILDDGPTKDELTARSDLRHRMEGRYSAS
jgi:hypothetical protein